MREMSCANPGALRSDFDVVPVPLRGTKTKDRARSCPVLFPWQKQYLKFAKKNADGEGEKAFTRWSNSSRDLADACKRAEVPVLSLHGLRHVARAWMLSEGLDSGTVSAALGHRYTRMVELVYDTRDLGEIQRRAEEQVRRRRAR
jgi:integrase